MQLALSYETTHNIVAFSVLSVIFHNFRSNIFHNFVDCLPEKLPKEKALTLRFGIQKLLRAELRAESKEYVVVIILRTDD